MNGNKENHPHNTPAVNEAVTEKVIKPVIFILLVVVLTKLVLYYSISDSEGSDVGIMNQTEVNRTIDNNTGTEPNVTESIVRVRQNVVKQPSCPKSYMLVILKEICADLIVKNEFCTPEDFYNKSKHINPRAKRKIPPANQAKVPSIMNYIVGGLLLTSLGAALVELYKAKKQVPRKNGKCPLSRKSSLADLTVMKHQRKELIRRESIMEVPEESPQLTQMGSNSPLHQHRRSTPVGPTASSFNQIGAVANEEEVTELIGQVSTTEIRRMSLSDSRRSSVIERRISTDYRMLSVDGRRPSVDDSPEKRHHRLVHRHF